MVLKSLNQVFVFKQTEDRVQNFQISIKNVLRKISDKVSRDTDTGSLT